MKLGSQAIILHLLDCQELRYLTIISWHLQVLGLHCAWARGGVCLGDEG